MEKKGRITELPRCDRCGKQCERLVKMLFSYLPNQDDDVVSEERLVCLRCLLMALQASQI
jgi:hypothetical protein